MIQLLLIMAAFAALPAIGRLVKAVVEFFVKLVMMIFVLGLTGNEQLAAAITRLAELYGDEETMMAIPVEL